MFLNNLSHEIKLLLRSHWLLVLFISTTLLFAFAAFNGNKNIEKRLDDVARLNDGLQKKDSIMLATLSKIEKGKTVDGPNWRLPSDPMTIGYRHPRLAIMHPNEFSFIATGQSDMYTHFKSPTVYGNNFALDYSEMVNPVQLLFGNFDFAFVIIYILPLLIISFTFNILSKEKELGTLRLLSAQPLSMINWLLQKTGIRFLIFTIVSIVLLLVVIAIFSPNSFKNGFSMFGLVTLLSAYNLFWFVLSCVINIKVNNSAKNALTLIGLWLLIVLVLPASINQIGNSLYPVPSRLKMINEIRLIKKENESSQNKIMDEYLRNHPELALKSDKDNFGFWHNYFASEKVMEEKTKPILVEFEGQLKKQQDLISMFKYLSPAIVIQQSLNNLAGTSEKHYNDYKKQVFEFSDKWRNYLAPMLFNNQKFTIKNYNEMPVFNYENRIKNNIWLSAIILVFTSAIVFFLFNSKRLKNKSAQQFMD
jgi:ABC-2 type transport system permease protein